MSEGRDELGPGDERLRTGETRGLLSDRLVGGDERGVVRSKGIEVPAPGSHVTVLLHALGGAPKDVDLLPHTFPDEGASLGCPVPRCQPGGR